MLKRKYLEQIYAGWLAKIIGIRLGAPVEGWTYEKIKNLYGEIDGYLVDYAKHFAADDDSNGPLFFLRALEDRKGDKLTAQDVGDALLNYAPYEHGFFWWGSYGVSTEHTAYLNLRNGIPAPLSGSIAQNGAAVAEQIGGQIFIDTWGLVAPGNPDLAAELAGKAASVTHDGNGIYGGQFIAACIAYAFDEPDMRKIIEKGLSYIPVGSEYTRVVRAVMAFYDAHPDNWRDCFQYVFENFGYDRYPGGCHIIPNTAVMIIGLLYGAGDFSRTLNICNMCGWDTDCTVGNIATIMGVRHGLSDIDDTKWRKAIYDLLICSSVIGSLNIMDIPYGACYIAKLAWDLAGEELPEPWKDIIANRIDSCHFEFPGSTHAMQLRVDSSFQTAEYRLTNSNEQAYTGNRSLKAMVKSLYAGERVYLYKKTYYKPDEFHNSRYDPCFSPLLYPGQTIHASIYLSEHSEDCLARLYARTLEDGSLIESDSVRLPKGQWTPLSFTLPRMEGALLHEAGVLFDMLGNNKPGMELLCYLDDLYFDGVPSYTIDFARCEVEKWNHLHKEISQFTRLKGILHLEGDVLNISCTDYAEAYTGHYNWTDYTAGFTMTPMLGQWHMANVRVQGALRSYAAGFTSGEKLGLYKNENGYRKLAETDFDWKLGQTYIITICAKGAELTVSVDGVEMLRFTDDAPYLNGCIGVSTRNNSRCSFAQIDVR